MVIKYCPFCVGKPYTDDLSRGICPNCGTELLTEMVSGSNGPEGRYRLSFSDNASAGNSNSTVSSLTDNSSVSSSVSGNVSAFGGDGGFNVTPSGANSFTGKVVNYTCAQGEKDRAIRRPFLKKLYQFIVYGQKSDDVLHRFFLYTGQSNNIGYSDSSNIPVNVYGSISDGMIIDNNEMLEIRGKFRRDKIFMAREAYIVNNGNPVKIRFRHSPKFIADLIWASIIIILSIFTAITYDGTFVEGISSLAITWILMTLIFLILYFALLKWIALILLIKKGSKTIGGLFASSFIASLVFMNRELIWASTGNIVSQFFWAVLVAAAIFAIIAIALRIIM